MKRLSDCRILIVDDVKTNIDILVNALKGEYRLSVALNGEAALKNIEAGKPDLVLLDVMMPGMNGYEVCRRMRDNPQTADIPVMFLTALDEVKNKARGFEVGGADYVTKPFELLEVKARVRSLLKAKIYNDEMVDYRKTLEAEVNRRTAELQLAKDRIGKSFIETVFRLALAAEFKDTDTGAHILRIGRYTAEIARHMGYDEDFANSLLYAAPLHDIGKIGIPDNILLKPAKLDPEEWCVMKRHTEFGAAILEGSRSPIISLGCTIAISHHEKWDGTGYPNGLKADDIPPVGCITAVADVFDALISKRCYKDSMPLEKALEIIRQGAGAHFSPRVVHAFFDRRDAILEINQIFADHQENLLAKHFSEVLGESPDDGILLSS